MGSESAAGHTPESVSDTVKQPDAGVATEHFSEDVALLARLPILDTECEDALRLFTNGAVE